MDELLTSGSYKHSLITDELEVLSKESDDKNDSQPNSNKKKASLMREWIQLSTPTWTETGLTETQSNEEIESNITLALQKLKQNAKLISSL